MPAKPQEDEILVQLATRIPKALHREIKLYCVESGMSVMQFVSEALEHKLKRSGSTKKR